MELTYQGGHDAVLVPLPSGAEPEVKHGQSYNFPNDRALLMLEQPENWRRTEPEVPIAERLAKAKSAADVDAIAGELGVVFDDTVKTVADKKAALTLVLEERAAADHSNDNGAGEAGQELIT